MDATRFHASHTHIHTHIVSVSVTITVSQSRLQSAAKRCMHMHKIQITLRIRNVAQAIENVSKSHWQWDSFWNHRGVLRPQCEWVSMNDSSAALKRNISIANVKLNKNNNYK